jgi:hypothetical protein
MRCMRLGQIVAITLLLVLAGGTLQADVKTEEKTVTQFGGALGRIVGLFGGKAAREGIVNTVALKGNRMMTSSEATGQIIDLDEEKVYELDMRRKNYTVVTFDELRRRLRQEQEKAEKEAQKEAEKGPQFEFEMDFDIKETGQRKNINGFDTREVVMTITMREKGKTLEESGGMVLVSNTWMTDEANAAQQIIDFQRRYNERLGLDVHAKDMLQAMAFFPGLKDAMDRMEKENVNIQGTAVLTNLTVDSHKSKEQLAQEQRQASSGDSPAAMLGGLARRIGRKQQEEQQQTQQDKAHSSILTATTELLSLSTNVSAAEVAIPDGFKQRR